MNPPPALSELSRLQVTAERIPELVILDLNGTTRPLGRIERIGAQAVLLWDPPIGVLQRAATVLGPWIDLPAARSPFTNTLVAPRQFLRVRQ